jgi:ring-1,2-phenylacetyl-CoA epoxidase subunit PaaE
VQSAPPPSPVEALPHEIVAILDGTRHVFGMRDGEHVIDAALRAGVKVPYSCKGGMCCTCRARVLDGSVTMTMNYSLEPWEIEKGFVLTCQAVPTSPRLVLDYDAL